jgi:ComF family protein
MASGRVEESAVTLCGNCRAEEPGFDAARAYGLYTGPLRALILEMKFGARRRLGPRLGRLLVERWPWVVENSGGQAPVLVPVPLHASRRRARGFNQAERIAEGLYEAVRERTGENWPGVEVRALLRTRRTPPQTGLSVAARKENVRGAFSVAAPERVRGRAVVLIDDVMTTGETVAACARVLRGAGAERVLALAVARATPQFPDTGPPPEPVDGGASG